jgi:hypothetical protein
MLPPVKVFINFESVQVGSKPTPCILNPVDMTDEMGMFDPTDYEGLKEAILDVVESGEQFFHCDRRFTYNFKEESLQHGAIYGRKNKKADDEEEGSKITAAKLIPIRSPSQFKDHIKNIAEVIYKNHAHRRGRPSTKSKRKKEIDYYKIELCVILIKERVPQALSKKRKKTTTSAPQAPIATIVTTSSSSSSTTHLPSDTSSNTLGEEQQTTTATLVNTTSSMRKSHEVKKFKAHKIIISLQAPIETIRGTTAPPQGTTNKDIMYDLQKYISGGSFLIDNTSDNEEEEDETFDNFFTLSRFRVEVMKLAVEKFSSHYSLNTHSLGPQSILYILKEWHRSAWSPIETTEDLHRNLLDQMDTKNRVKNDTLTIRLAFGKAQVNKHFVYQNAFDAYTTYPNGEGFDFSQNGDPSSPFKRRSGKEMRHEIHDVTKHLMSLITKIYQTESSKLYHGFLYEHINTFFRIMQVDVQAFSKDSVFMTDGIPTDDELDKHLISFYAQRHRNDVVTKTGGRPLLPETRKYPPTNATMVNAPPTLDEWNDNNRNNCNSHHHNHHYNHHQRQNDICNEEQHYNTKEVSGFLFRLLNDEDVGITAFIDDPLTESSTMKEVMEYENVIDELKVLDIENCKFHIKKKSGPGYMVRYGRFHSMSIKKVFSLKDLHKDLVIEIEQE